MANRWGNSETDCFETETWPEKSPAIKALLASAAAAAKSLQSCLTLCDPIDSSPPGSPVPGILQARTLEWVAIFFSNAWKWKVKVKSLSRVQLCDPMDCSLPGSSIHGISRQEYWSGVPLPSPVSPLVVNKYTDTLKLHKACFSSDFYPWILPSISRSFLQQLLL